MFCIIEGRNFRKMAMDSLCTKPQYLRGFMANYYYIVLLLLFLLLFYQLHFCFSHSITVFVLMLPSFPFFLFDPLPSFNYVLSIEPTFIQKHVIVSILDVFFVRKAFLRFFSINQNFWNDPASVRKILVEFVFLGHFQAF